ncbi:MAG: bifunctional UDP-N-acetylmuramoyl-tripeptide:D-alanyl-D-alanine ligase/alanine racemase [Bacteroidales bacterium]|nr:bifunctional UDP-N-acetylmuramoyl-tripeptide:D-alanyl-D-alanine ligase/alanine racemase [Bacteroidales bacterium]
MPAYKLSEICDMAGGQLFGAPLTGIAIRHLLTDSRRLIAPAGSMFVAIVTPKNDGHRYIETLFERGVRCFMVSRLPDPPSPMLAEAAFVKVNDTLLALQNLAAAHRASISLPVVGITGSNGKTIIKEWLFQLLSEKMPVVRNPRSYNSQIGVPLSVWQIERKHQLGIFEAGISQAGEMEKLERVVQPDVGIFTNIGPAHDEGFPEREIKIREKLKLFVHANTLIYCRDHSELDHYIRKWQAQHPTVRLFSWSVKAGADLHVTSLRRTDNHTHIRIDYQGKEFDFEIPFTDHASVENALHCMAFLCHMGYSNGWIREKMAQLQPVAMRMEMKEGINNCLVINDSYNNDLNSLAIALDFLNTQTRHPQKTLILSDILQTGILPAALYAEVAGMLRAKGVGKLIGIGKDISANPSVFSFPALFYDSTEDFLTSFNPREFDNEAILLKGARVFGFERISNLLQQKDHQTILEVNLDALVHNLNVYRSLLKPKVKVMAMVKAFSYGSGSVEVAGVLQYHHAEFLAVAYADEGKELRKGGIQLPIVVMNPEVRSLEVLHKYRLEPEVYSLKLLQRVAQAAIQFEAVSPQHPFLIHLKLDTGMHRLGFLTGELDEVIKALTENPLIRVASVFSHLAASDDPAHDDFTRLQIANFSEMCQKLEEGLGYPFLRHISNSAAINRFPQAQFDMVRLGIGLYGVSSDTALQDLLQNVSTFRSVVSQVKRIPSGESIGYSRMARTTSETEIAIVPVGYADGLNRRLSNGVGHLFIKGHKAPIVGQISMDMCAVDVTGLDVSEGEEVIIFGKEIPIAGIAKALETIPYEVLTSVSQRVKRVYFQE